MAETGTVLLLEPAAVAVLAAAAVVLLILSAAIERSGPIRLSHWSEQAGGRLRDLYEARARFEAFRLLLSFGAHALPIVLLVFLRTLAPPAEGADALRVWLWPLAAVAAVLVAAELINRALVARDPEPWLRRLTWAYRVAYVAALPLLAPTARVLSAGAARRRESEEEDEASEEEIEAFLSVGAQEGILEPGEEDLIQRVIDFGDARVKSVMTPRIDMVCAPVEADPDDLSRVFIEHRHSRVPLYRDSVDEIVGILHIRHLLEAQGSGGPVEVVDIALPAFFVPETKPLAELLREFQAKGQQMAIVVDEYGGTSGLVTVEDLLEEIVGEIMDEHEEVETPAERISEGRWRVEGRAPLSTLGQLFAIELRGVPYETVGGLIFGLVGSVPEPGAVVDAHGLRFLVERVEERRIQTVSVERLEVGGESSG